jgi:hypothetical protein
VIAKRASGLAAAAALLVGLSGCGGDATAPRLNLAGSYDLFLYEGQQLPVVTSTIIAVSGAPGGTGYSCDDKLTRSLLEFTPDSRYRQTDSHLMVCDDGRPDEASSSITTGDYLPTNAGVELDADAVTSSQGRIVQRSLASINDVQLTVYTRTVYLNGSVYATNFAPLVFHANP